MGENIVAISDLHLGAPSSLLNLPSAAAGLFREIDSVGPITDFVMVGDVLDLTMSSRMNAWNKAQQFFRDLSEHLGQAQVWYLPGNHDHHVWSMLIEEKGITSKLMRAQEEDRVIALDRPPLTEISFDSDTFVHGLFPGAVRKNVHVRYPFVWLPCGQKQIAFHHGHYFDRRMAPLAKRAAKKYRSRENVEEHSFALLEALYYNLSASRASRELLSRAYIRYQRIRESIGSGLSALGAKFPRSETRRRKKIRDMMFLLDDRDSYILVTGHTHVRDDKDCSPHGTIQVFNTGGWIVEFVPPWKPHVEPAIFHAKDGRCTLKKIEPDPADIALAAEKAMNVWPLR